jgi:hypothetical protein
MGNGQWLMVNVVNSEMVDFVRQKSNLKLSIINDSIKSNDGGRNQAGNNSVIKSNGGIGYFRSH